MNISDLIVEVTRKCNISCDHCLRGEAVNLNLKKEYVDSLLNQISGIGSICFTGGEPSLNVPIMEYFLDECKRRGISIGGFYIATNGINVPESFALFCLKLYSYCDTKEMCVLHLSNDMYHTAEATYDTSLLSGLTFFSKKFDKDYYDYEKGEGLLNEGRSKDKRKAKAPYVPKHLGPNEFEYDCEVYLNCKGEIINGCNWSYNTQKKHKLCDVGELTQYYEKLKELEMEGVS